MPPSTLRKPSSLIGRAKRQRPTPGYAEFGRLFSEEIIETPSLYANVLHMSGRTGSSAILSVRVTPNERALLEAAAEQSGATLSEFMRRKSVEAAEMEVLGRSIVSIPAQDWEAFEAWINRPAEAKEKLAKLARRKPSWER
jgi:uncharacterized protein (DUF1778 family)